MLFTLLSFLLLKLQPLARITSVIIKDILISSRLKQPFYRHLCKTAPPQEEINGDEDDDDEEADDDPDHHHGDVVSCCQRATCHCAAWDVQLWSQSVRIELLKVAC